MHGSRWTIVLEEKWTEVRGQEEGDQREREREIGEGFQEPLIALLGLSHPRCFFLKNNVPKEKKNRVLRNICRGCQGRLGSHMMGLGPSRALQPDWWPITLLLCTPVRFGNETLDLKLKPNAAFYWSRDCLFRSTSLEYKTNCRQQHFLSPKDIQESCNRWRNSISLWSLSCVKEIIEIEKYRNSIHPLEYHRTIIHNSE